MTKPHVVLKPVEAAKYLRISQSTIYILLNSGQLPARKIGGSWRISRAVLDEWLKGEFVTGSAPQTGQVVTADISPKEYKGGQVNE